MNKPTYEELLAQNAELITVLNRIDLWKDFSPSEKCDLGSWGERDHYRKVAEYARDKSPAACIATIKAQALEGFAEDLEELQRLNNAYDGSIEMHDAIAALICKSED